MLIKFLPNQIMQSAIDHTLIWKETLKRHFVVLYLVDTGKKLPAVKKTLAMYSDRAVHECIKLHITNASLH